MHIHKHPEQRMWDRIEANAIRDTRRLCAAIFRTLEEFKAQLPSEYQLGFLFIAIKEFTWSDVHRMRANLEAAENAGDVFKGTALEACCLASASIES
ncbi:hypothetical protein LXM94_02540 [Rhizobium sp. TRM95111]|uniref:hypothetical protein n=1 Tax=Rhizobium alarense TaxID=2846851 RepID=UPI001F34AD97|nr:hypothetical protein [Rhizobium alarense]MCF3638846.1 hypothetical protein [Rhizobium alarense]